MSVPTASGLADLERRRAAIRRATENMLLEARDQGRNTLSEGEDRRYRQARADLTALDEQIADTARSSSAAGYRRTCGG